MMAIITLAYMVGMYQNQRANIGIIGESFAVLARMLAFQFRNRASGSAQANVQDADRARRVQTKCGGSHQKMRA